MSREQFTTIYNENFELLKRIVTSVTHDWSIADDIVQDTFVRIWLTELNKIEHQRIELDDIRNVTTYLCVIVKRTALRYTQRRNKMLVWDAEAQRRLINERTSAHLRGDIVRIMSALPKQQKRVVVMHTHGWSCEEIGSILHIAMYTARNHLKAAHKSLKTELER